MRTFPTKSSKILTAQPPGSDQNEGATLPFDPNRILDVETSGSSKFLRSFKFFVAIPYQNNKNFRTCCNHPNNNRRCLAVHFTHYCNSCVLSEKVFFSSKNFLIVFRRSAHNLRNMYGPAYQIRPVATGFTVRKTTKGFDSYEDHLEKAARLSSELSSYNVSVNFEKNCIKLFDILAIFQQKLKLN